RGRQSEGCNHSHSKTLMHWVALLSLNASCVTGRDYARAVPTAPEQPSKTHCQISRIERPITLSVECTTSESTCCALLPLPLVSSSPAAPSRRARRRHATRC